MAVYTECVDFLIKAAQLLGVTYRDSNAILFFVLWPAITLALVIVVLVQGRALRAARELAASRRDGSAAPSRHRRAR